MNNQGAEELPWTDGAGRAATTRTLLDTETETLAPFFTDPQLKITYEDSKVCYKEEVSASGSGMTLDQLRTYGDQNAAREFVRGVVVSLLLADTDLAQARSDPTLQDLRTVVKALRDEAARSGCNIAKVEAHLTDVSVGTLLLYLRAVQRHPKLASGMSSIVFSETAKTNPESVPSDLIWRADIDERISDVAGRLAPTVGLIADRIDNPRAPGPSGIYNTFRGL